MALTRKFLSALGIEADKIDEIIEAHSDTVNKILMVGPTTVVNLRSESQ